MNESTANQRVRGYRARREVWRIGGRPIDLTWPDKPDALLDAPRTRERFARNEYMPYWAQPWPASVLLAEHILLRTPVPPGPAVEIGCGIGLVSVVAALAGWRITAGDYDEDALAFAELNAARNGVSLAGSVLVDFMTGPAGQRYDCILAADLLYERRLVQPLAAWIESALGPNGYGLVCDPNRSAADDFPDQLARRGLSVRATEQSTTGPSGLLIRGRIWRIARESHEDAAETKQQR